MRFLRHGIVTRLGLSTVQPETSRKQLQVELLHMENMLLFQSRIRPQHRHIRFPSQLILLIVILHHRSDNTLDVVKWRVSYIKLLEIRLEVIINEVLVDVLKWLVLVVVTNFLCVVRLLIVQQQQRHTCAVEPSTTANSVTIVGDRWWDIKQNDMTQIWEVQPSGCHLSADHNTILKISTYKYLLLSEIKIGAGSELLIQIAMNLKHPPFLNLLLSHLPITIPVHDIIQQIVNILDLSYSWDKDHYLALGQDRNVGQSEWDLLLLTDKNVLLFQVARSVDLFLVVVLRRIFHRLNLHHVIIPLLVLYRLDLGVVELRFLDVKSNILRIAHLQVLYQPLYFLIKMCRYQYLLNLVKVHLLLHHLQNLCHRRLKSHVQCSVSFFEDHAFYVL